MVCVCENEDERMMIDCGVQSVGCDPSARKELLMKQQTEDEAGLVTFVESGRLVWAEDLEEREDNQLSQVCLETRSVHSLDIVVADVRELMMDLREEDHCFLHP